MSKKFERLDQKIVRLLKTKHKGMAVQPKLLLRDIDEPISLIISRLESLTRRGMIKSWKLRRCPKFYYYARGLRRRLPSRRDRGIPEGVVCQIVTWYAGKKKLCGRPAVALWESYYVCEKHKPLTKAEIAREERKITRLEEAYCGPEERRYRLLQR